MVVFPDDFFNTGYPGYPLTDLESFQRLENRWMTLGGNQVFDRLLWTPDEFRIFFPTVQHDVVIRNDSPFTEPVMDVVQGKDFTASRLVKADAGQTVG